MTRSERGSDRGVDVRLGNYGVAIGAIVVALVALVLFLLVRNSAEFKLRKYSEANPINFKAVAKTEFDSDAASYRTMIGLCRWKEKKCGEIEAKYDYSEGSPLRNYMGNRPYASVEKEVDAAVGGELEALEESFSRVLGSIIENSSAAVRGKREQIFEALAGEKYKRLLGVAELFAGKENARGYQEAMKLGLPSVENSILFAVYPKSMVAGCHQTLVQAMNSGNPELLSKAIGTAKQFRGWFWREEATAAGGGTGAVSVVGSGSAAGRGSAVGGDSAAGGGSAVGGAGRGLKEDPVIARAEEKLKEIEREKAAAEAREKEQRMEQYRKAKAESDKRREKSAVAGSAASSGGSGDSDDEYYYANDLDGFLDDLGDEFDDEDEAIDAWEDRED